jgi:hypothetical protein
VKETVMRINQLQDYIKRGAKQKFQKHEKEEGRAPHFRRLVSLEVSALKASKFDLIHNLFTIRSSLTLSPVITRSTLLIFPWASGITLKYESKSFFPLRGQA